MEKIFRKLSYFFVKKWQLGVLDIDRGCWCVAPELKNIKYLKAENAQGQGRHILVQPLPEVAPYYLLIDDINWPIIKHHHCKADKTWKKGRMVIETSPENYQVWIHSSNAMSIDNKRYWLKQLHSDPGSDPNKRWGRCPGFRNRKEKYRDPGSRYPLSKLIWVDWKYQVKIPQIESEEKNKKIICRSD